MPTVKLLALPASHACAVATAMLEAKHVPYERVDLFPGLSRAWLRLTGFDDVTVPALRVAGDRIQGSRAIARALDERWPDPPLFPADPSQRQRVEEIETWADGPLQMTARRIMLWALCRSGEARAAALEGARLQFHFPIRLAEPLGAPVVRLDAMLNGVGAAATRADLDALPYMLGQADHWIAQGDLARTPPTAADYQVAASVRMLLTIEDLAPVFAQRPVAELARTLVPILPGHVPAGMFTADRLPIAATSSRADERNARNPA
jgi:glutathione S-transferase